MPTIYAMVGTIGAGKTTFAAKLANEKNAVFYSIDRAVKDLGKPITSREDYDKYYFLVRTAIAAGAVEALKNGRPVVLDFGGSRGHAEWLDGIAAEAGAAIEIYHLLAPLEVRRERVRKRNLEPDVVFRFSDEEFDSMPTVSAAPEERAGLKVRVVRTG